MKRKYIRLMLALRGHSANFLRYHYRRMERQRAERGVWANVLNVGGAR